MTALVEEVRASYYGAPASNKGADSDEVDDNVDDDIEGNISAPDDSDSEVDVNASTDVASTDVSALMVSGDKDPLSPLSLCEDEPPILSDQNDSSNEGCADDDIAVGPSTSGASTSGFSIGNFDALNPSNNDETPSPVSTMKSIFEVGSRTRISFYILFQRKATSMSEEKSLALGKRFGKPPKEPTNNNTD
jgi:hypothetical protein